MDLSDSVGLRVESSLKVFRLSPFVRALRRGSTYFFLFVRPDGKILTEIASLVENKKIKPVLDRIFPFSEAPAAMAYAEQGHARGKVILSVN